MQRNSSWKYHFDFNIFAPFKIHSHDNSVIDNVSFLFFTTEYVRQTDYQYYEKFRARFKIIANNNDGFLKRLQLLYISQYFLFGWNHLNNSLFHIMQSGDLPQPILYYYHYKCNYLGLNKQFNKTQCIFLLTHFTQKDDLIPYPLLVSTNTKKAVDYFGVNTAIIFKKLFLDFNLSLQTIFGIQDLETFNSLFIIDIHFLSNEFMSFGWNFSNTKEKAYINVNYALNILEFISRIKNNINYLNRIDKITLLLQNFLRMATLLGITKEINGNIKFYCYVTLGFTVLDIGFLFIYDNGLKIYFIVHCSGSVSHRNFNNIRNNNFNNML